MRRPKRGELPNEVPACWHVYWGVVSLVGVEDQRESRTDYQHINCPLLDVFTMLGGSYVNLVLHAWVDHLMPLTPAARDMLAVARAGGRR